jgi:hypothetical protein
MEEGILHVEFLCSFMCYILVLDKVEGYLNAKVKIVEKIHIFNLYLYTILAFFKLKFQFF